MTTKAWSGANGRPAETRLAGSDEPAINGGPGPLNHHSHTNGHYMNAHAKAGPSSSAMAGTSTAHGRLVLSTWDKLVKLIGNGVDAKDVLVDGHTIDVASVVAVARYGAQASIDENTDIEQQVDRSVEFLQHELQQGHSVYGVTTGFGGSADTRTPHTAALQRGLLQHHLAGILPVQSQGESPSTARGLDVYKPNGDPYASLSMPEAWVRGAMLVRANSLVRGHSAVRLAMIRNLVGLLRRDLIPLVPLRGSISASGDLTPLCYIAAALDGNPDVKVWAGAGPNRKLIPSNEALEVAGLKRVELQAKEGLGVLNGTAVSAAVASLAVHEANNLAALSQVLTAMGVEALLGTAESFHPFIAQVRPHQGQIEAAQNILCFLQGSGLASFGHGESSDGTLRQDRYAVRTSSQWIGPQLEDLQLAYKQLEVEINSTTDNPLIDVAGHKVHHGGNFQAAAVTSSTEKTRLALQMLSKMLFAQCAELLDNTRNNGLPPNLAPDDPSLSYLMKGVDINMASYMAELAFLANPVSSHVQSAEMGNQAINSMALVSTRYTHMAVDTLSLMCSAYLYCLCHALDLRAMQAQFAERLHVLVESLTMNHLGHLFGDVPMEAFKHCREGKEAGLRALHVAVDEALPTTIAKDASVRFEHVALAGRAAILDHLSDPIPTFQEMGFIGAKVLPSLRMWTPTVARGARDLFESQRQEYYETGDATPHLGMASARLYNFVRKDLGVPFHRGLCDYPTVDKAGTPEGTHVNGAPLANPGSWISVIHEALRSGKLMTPVMECLREAQSAPSAPQA